MFSLISKVLKEVSLRNRSYGSGKPSFRATAMMCNLKKIRAEEWVGGASECSRCLRKRMTCKHIPMRGRARHHAQSKQKLEMLQPLLRVNAAARKDPGQIC